MSYVSEQEQHTILLPQIYSFSLTGSTEPTYWIKIFKKYQNITVYGL